MTEQRPHVHKLAKLTIAQVRRQAERGYEWGEATNRELAQALIESQQAIRSALRMAESVNDAALYNVLLAALLEEVEDEHD